jgi:hypothetical protein
MTIPNVLIQVAGNTKGLALGTQAIQTRLRPYQFRR